MEKILDIVGTIAQENGLPQEQVIWAIKDSMIKMAKKEINENANFLVIEDWEAKELRLVQKMIVCDDETFNEDMESTHVPLSDARNLIENVNAGDELEYQINLKGMNRNAVNHIFHDITFQIQKLNEQEMLKSFEKDINRIVIGQVVHVDNEGNTLIELGETRALLPLKNRIKGEKFKVGQSVRSILKSARITRNGIKIELSRTTPKLLEELLMLEVPEIKDGEVVIHKIARIPGEKAKVALYTKNPKIDPIGSAVGAKGVRINAISKELHGENIDCIEYSSVPEIFAAKSLSPAQVISVKLQQASNDSERPLAIVQIAKSQKSKAIGKAGANIRLASMLTNYNFELQEIAEKANDQQTNKNPNEKEEEKKLGLEALESLFKGN